MLHEVMKSPFHFARTYALGCVLAPINQMKTLLLSFLPFTVDIFADESTSEWTGPKCDDMIPNLCDDLKLSSGKVKTRDGLFTKYFLYTPSTLDNNKLPIVAVNGGPGLSHDYLDLMKQLACDGREVVFYDQAGTGAASLPENVSIADTYPFLYTVDYYGQTELPALIEALGYEKYHLYGSSFGTTIATEFAIHSKTPARNGLQSILLDGPIPSGAELVREMWKPETGNFGRLPEYTKERLLAIEASGDFDSEEYSQLESSIFNQIYYRTTLLADCALKSFGNINQETYFSMCGPADFFNWTGTLKDYSLLPELPTLADLPVLLTYGGFDLVSSPTIKKMKDMLPLAEVKLYKYSGHDSLFDALEDNLETQRDFYDRVEEALGSGKMFEPVVNADDDGDGSTSSFRNYWWVTILTGLIAFAGGIFASKKLLQHPHKSQYENLDSA